MQLEVGPKSFSFAKTFVVDNEAPFFIGIKGFLWALSNAFTNWAIFVFLTKSRLSRERYRSAFKACYLESPNY